MRLNLLAALVAVVCFLFIADAAQAGPIARAVANAQERREARRAPAGCSECAGCQAVPATAPGVHAAKPTVLTLPATGDCPGGKCPAPVERRGVFGLRR